MATIVVEDGSIVTGANSYVTQSELVEYAADRDVTLTAATDVLIMKSMDYLESLGFIGLKVRFEQPLQFPRTDMVVDRFWLPSDEIPQLIKDGLCEIAIAIDRDESPLKDVERKTVKEKVDTLEVQYTAGSSTNTIVRTINAKLHKFLISSGNNFNVSRGKHALTSRRGRLW